jgi:mono/diheme cytochrome c family protein
MLDKTLNSVKLGMKHARKWTTIIAACLAVSAIGTAALAQDPSEQGHAVLKEFCAGCHAIEKTGDSPLAAAPPFRALGNSFDLDQFPRRLERGLSSSHPGMPEFKFTADDARAATAYLRSIQQ